MKTIRISKNVKLIIDEFRENGENVNTALTRLFSMVEENRFNADDGATSVDISEENLELLKSHKAYSTETYSSIILRLIQSIK